MKGSVCKALAIYCRRYVRTQRSSFGPRLKPPSTAIALLVSAEQINPVSVKAKEIPIYELASASPCMLRAIPYITSESALSPSARAPSRPARLGASGHCWPTNPLFGARSMSKMALCREGFSNHESADDSRVE